jgi:hypothetical protein
MQERDTVASSTHMHDLEIQKERGRLQHGTAAILWWTRCGALVSGFHGRSGETRGSVGARRYAARLSKQLAYLTAVFVNGCPGVAWRLITSRLR